MPNRPDPAPLPITTDVELAVERLRAGGLVGLPTETVYGLAADAGHAEAVARIFEVKGRPHDHPLIVHLAASTWAERADEWVAHRPPTADLLAAACWPGPLTMLLPRGPRVSDATVGGRASVGIRIPAHSVAQALLEEFGGGLAAPSANPFGRVSPTTAQHVAADLGDRLDPERDLILDGGPSEVGVESTIIDLTVGGGDEPPQLLRAGAITATEIERLLAAPVEAASGPSRASGMLASHYAPDCAVVLADDRGAASALADEHRRAGRRADVLDHCDDLVTAARNLYNDLRAADRRGLDVLVAVQPPAAGLGHAIRDRLAKAAATRPAPHAHAPHPGPSPGRPGGIEPV